MTCHPTNRLRSLLGAAFVGLAAAGSAAAAPATYDFSIDVGGTSVSGFFTIDDTNAGYTGGGTTTKAALLDYEFDFTRGAESLIGTPANNSGLQTFNLTYAADLLSVTTWDISIAFGSPNSVSFTGNNIVGGGFAQVSDFRPNRPLRDSTGTPILKTTLRQSVNTVPVPATLALVLAGLACLPLARRRSATTA